MPDLPHTFPGYIQTEETIFKAGVSEYLAQKLGRIANFLADKGLKVDLFTSNGTWTSGPTDVLALVCGLGGGGGGGGAGGSTLSGPSVSYLGGAGGGGGLAPFGMFPVVVTPSTNYSITIGAGGAAGGPGASTLSGGGAGGNGGTGGDSIFGASLAVFKGAYGGRPGLGSTALVDGLPGDGIGGGLPGSTTVAGGLGGPGLLDLYGKGGTGGNSKATPPFYDAATAGSQGLILIVTISA